MYNKLAWLGLHLLVMSVRLFVILFNRSLRPQNDESHHKLDAWMQGEVFSIF